MRAARAAVNIANAVWEQQDRMFTGETNRADPGTEGETR